MKAKNIKIGSSYVLARTTNSKPGLSMKYFDHFKNKKVLALENLLSYDSRNTVKVQGIYTQDDKDKLVSFWCHPFDLEEIEAIGD